MSWPTVKTLAQTQAPTGTQQRIELENIVPSAMHLFYRFYHHSTDPHVGAIYIEMDTMQSLVTLNLSDSDDNASSVSADMLTFTILCVFNQVP